MAYTSYTRNPDSTLTFSGDGHEDLLGYGPAAEAHAAGIDAAMGQAPAPAGAGMAALDAAAAQPVVPMFAGPGASKKATDIGDIEQAVPSKDLGDIERIVPRQPDLYVKDEPTNAQQASAAYRSSHRGAPAVGTMTTVDPNQPTAAEKASASYRSAHHLSAEEQTKAAEELGKKADAAYVADQTGQRAGPTVAASTKPAPGGIVMNQPYEPLGGGAAPSGPTRSVPEHEQQVSRSTTQQIEPDNIGVRRNVLGEIEKGNVDQLTTADVGRAEAIADQRTAAISEARDRDNEVASREVARRQMMQSKLDDMDRLNESLKNEPIDSGRLMRNKTDLEKFSGGIALALSDFGATMTHTENQGAKIIADAVASDVADQRTNWERKKEGIEQGQSLFADYHAILGDARAAEAATRAHMLDRAKDEIDGIIAGTESPRIKAIGEKAKTDIDQRILNDQAHVQSYMQSETFRTVPAHTEGPAAPATELVEAHNIVYPPGQNVGYQFTEEEEFKQARQKAETAATLNEVADRYLYNLKHHAGDPAYAHVLDQDSNTMADLTNAAFLGSERATNNGLLNEIKENIAPGKHIPENALNRYSMVVENMKKTANQAADRALQSGVPVTRRTVVHGKYMVQPLQGGPHRRFNTPGSSMTQEGD